MRHPCSRISYHSRKRITTDYQQRIQHIPGRMLIARELYTREYAYLGREVTRSHTTIIMPDTKEFASVFCTQLRQEFSGSSSGSRG